MATESALPLVPVALGAAQVEQGGNDYVGQLPVRRLVPVIMIVNFQRYAGRDAACSLSGSFLSSDVDARAWAAGARVVGVEAVDSTLTQDFSSAQASRPRYLLSAGDNRQSITTHHCLFHANVRSCFQLTTNLTSIQQNESDRSADVVGGSKRDLKRLSFEIVDNSSSSICTTSTHAVKAIF